jgi:outer membrane receptor for ferrienterochelin and colicin
MPQEKRTSTIVHFTGIHQLLSCLIVLSSLSITTKAQSQFIVHGSVVDSFQNKPLDAATISIFRNQAPGAAIASSITSASGVFNLKLVDSGLYSLQVSFAGYNPQRLMLNVDKSEIDVGTIKLIKSSSTLNTVVVESQQKLVEQSDDKITYNTEKDPLARGQGALDILRRVPFVSVDGNNNIRLNGQTNFKVLLNGRETAMFANNVSDALQGFPGTAITKIEVITNPSAKYDAEGIGGIINIITKKRIEGYNGSVSAWSTTINQHIYNFNFNAKAGAVGIAINYSLRAFIDIPSTMTSFTVPTISSFYTKRSIEGNRAFNSLSHLGNGEISWAVDSFNTISVYGNITGGHSTSDNDWTTLTIFSQGNSIRSSFDQFQRREFPTYTVGTDFIRKYRGKPDKEFSFRVNAEIGKNNTFLESAESSASSTRFINNRSIANNKQYTIQTDYVLPIAAGKKIEIGARTTLRRATSDFQSLRKYQAHETYQLNPSNTDNFEFLQDIFSGYASYSFKIKSYSIRAGLRLEHTRLNGSFASAKAFAKNSYSNILPNLQVSTKINDLALVLSYNQRLQRPSIQHLNPFIDNNDSMNIHFGNPDLDAQTIHNVQLQTRLNKGKTFVGLTFSGSYSNNMIVTLLTFNPTTGVRSSTYRNVGRDFLFSVNGSVNAPLGKKWMANLGANFQYRTLQNKEMAEQKNSGIGGNTSLGATFTPNKKFSINNYIGFEQTIIDLQSNPKIIPFCGSGINYQAIPDKLRFGLIAQNYFARVYDYEVEMKGIGFQSTNINHNLMGKVVFTAFWSFGKLKEKVSKKVGVTNDDSL